MSVPQRSFLCPEDLALAKIRSADIDRMTPLQALELLADVSEMLKQST